MKNSASSDADIERLGKRMSGLDGISWIRGLKRFFFCTPFETFFRVEELLKKNMDGNC